MINGHLASEAQLNVAGMDWKKVNTLDESCLRVGQNVEKFRFLKNIHRKLDFSDIESKYSALDLHFSKAYLSVMKFRISYILIPKNQNFEFDPNFPKSIWFDLGTQIFDMM